MVNSAQQNINKLFNDQIYPVLEHFFPNNLTDSFFLLIELKLLTQIIHLWQIFMSIVYLQMHC